jgi:hypothetical protein
MLYNKLNSYLNKFLKWLHWFTVNGIFNKQYQNVKKEQVPKQIIPEKEIDYEKQINQEKENA